MKPKLPNGFPPHLYFYVRKSRDEYGRPSIVVSLYEKKKFWFDKEISSEEYATTCIYDYDQGRSLAAHIERRMRTLYDRYKRDTIHDTLIYGRHP